MPFFPWASVMQPNLTVFRTNYYRAHPTTELWKIDRCSFLIFVQSEFLHLKTVRRSKPKHAIFWWKVRKSSKKLASPLQTLYSLFWFGWEILVCAQPLWPDLHIWLMLLIVSSQLNGIILVISSFWCFSLMFIPQSSVPSIYNPILICPKILFQTRFFLTVNLRVF